MTGGRKRRGPHDDPTPRYIKMYHAWEGLSPERRAHLTPRMSDKIKAEIAAGFGGLVAEATLRNHPPPRTRNLPTSFFRHLHKIYKIS